MQPLTSVPELQKLLRWPRVTESVPVRGLRVFEVWPDAPGLERMHFLFDDGVTCMQQFGFGPWHGHYTQWSDERRNVRRAIATARTLMTGARCLFVERSSAGTYLGSGVVRRGRLPPTLSRDFATLERFVFNRPPELVPVDLTRFHRTKDGAYVDHELRRQLKSIYAGTELGRSFD